MTPRTSDGTRPPRRQGAAPISLGSSRLTTVDVAGFHITDARFPPGLVLHRHFHERACLTVVIEGAFAERFRSRTCELAESSLLAKPGGESHSDRFASTGSRQIIIEPSAQRLESAPLGRLFDGISCVRRDIERLARRAVREVHAADSLSPLALESLALELLVLLGRDEKAVGNGAPPAWLGRVRERLHHGFRQGITVDELAREADVPPTHLAREFRRHVGASPADYRRRLRLDWVAERLRDTEETIASLAALAGFYDQSHLTHSFRRVFGTTPAEYRRLKRGRE